MTSDDHHSCYVREQYRVVMPSSSQLWLPGTVLVIGACSLSPTSSLSSSPSPPLSSISLHHHNHYNHYHETILTTITKIIALDRDHLCSLFQQIHLSIKFTESDSVKRCLPVYVYIVNVLCPSSYDGDILAEL